jgi:hypothetical protein
MLQANDVANREIITIRMVYVAIFGPIAENPIATKIIYEKITS